MKPLNDINLICAAKTDQAAFEKLLPEFQRLVWYCYQKCVGGRNTGILNPEDFYQEGMCGLIRALRFFDPKRGKFTTFAIPYICGVMLHSMRAMRYPLHLPRRIYDGLGDANNNDPDVVMAKHIRISSLQELVSEQHSRDLDYEEVIPDKNHWWEDEVFAKVEFEQRIAQLTKREQQVVHLKLAGMTQKDIGDRLGLSQAHISRILKEIRKKLAA